MRVVKIILQEREDGGLRAYSDDVPGLILSHNNRVKLLADIRPAVMALLKHRGEDAEDVRIDAEFHRAAKQTADQREEQ